MTLDARSIRIETEATMKRYKVPMHPHLPLLDILPVRRGEDIARCIVAHYCLAGLANKACPKKLHEWLREEAAESCLSPGELELLEGQSLTEGQLNRLSWMEESLFVLCWSGAIVSDIPWPDSGCDLSPVFSSIPPAVPVSPFLKSFARAKDDFEVISQLDLYYCLHASLNHPGIWAKEELEDCELKLEVVLERRQALEWLCTPGVEWDDITLDT